MTDEPALTKKERQILYGKTTTHTRILDDYFEEGVSLDMLSAKYGRSRLSIHRLTSAATKAGRGRLKLPTDRRSVLQSPALTRVHKRIGMRFIRWRTIENSYSTVEAADALEVTLNWVHAVEGGIHNWTLLELVLVCEKLGWSLIDLLRGADLGHYLQPDAA